MNHIVVVTLFLFPLFVACAQPGPSQNDKVVGGSCEGCEAVYEYGNRKILYVDTLPDFNEAGQKLEVTGTIYKPDGKTPASNVILYCYHTDQAGLYSSGKNETGWGKRHGSLRGWIKTGADGRYKFYTLKPAPYPGNEIPAHIHMTLKEPGLSPYYVDEILFDDDPILTTRERSRQENRGGSAIVKTTVSADGMQVIKRDIVLGKNIPDYN
jgi:protocatechuate 3,4-dioxygenase beta subunit